MTKKPRIVVKSGTRVINSMEIRAPTRTKARNRQRSPIVKPTRPDSPSHSQVWEEASVGSGVPRVTRVNAPKRNTAITSRIKFTGSDPTLRPAFWKASALTVQQQAVASAASSPAWEKGGSMAG